jgi:hypothetical protein
MSLHLQFELEFDLPSNPDSHFSHASLCLHSLRIQIPEQEAHHTPKKEKPVEKKQQRQEEKQEQEQEQEQEDEHAEYVPMSPLYTWSDEQIRGIKQEQFGELLWPIVLRSYDITESASHFATYPSFRQSAVRRHPENYPHHSLRELMEWYVEDHLHLLKKGEPWTENVKRRWLLRKCFQTKRLVWAPEYFEVYLTWSKGCRAGMNRYQKMEQFIKEFFDK